MTLERLASTLGVAEIVTIQAPELVREVEESLSAKGWIINFAADSEVTMDAISFANLVNLLISAVVLGPQREETRPALSGDLEAQFQRLRYTEHAGKCLRMASELLGIKTGKTKRQWSE